MINDGFPSVWVIEGEKTNDASNQRVEFVKAVTENFQRYVDAGH
jgi:hypothetical protein